MLKFKKVCIDSSYKVNGSSSDFTIDLPETVQLEDNMLCQIHEVSIPNSWYSIQKGINDRIFVRVEHTGTGPWLTRAMVALTEGDCSVSDLAGHFQVILINYLNDAEFPPQRSDMFVVSHSNFLNKIRILENYNDIEFQIIPDSDILTHPEWFPDTSVHILNSINKVLQNYNVAIYDFNTSYYSGFVDFQRVKSLYLHCNEKKKLYPIDSGGSFINSQEIKCNSALSRGH